MTSTFYVRCCAAYASDSLAQEDLQLTFSLPKTVTHVPSLGVTHVVSCSMSGPNTKIIPGHGFGFADRDGVTKVLTMLVDLRW